MQLRIKPTLRRVRPKRVLACGFDKGSSFLDFIKTIHTKRILSFKNDKYNGLEATAVRDIESEIY
jgi:hypothetical protein